MSAYIPLKDYAKHLDIHLGDTIFISSDVIRPLADARLNRQKANINNLLDGFIEAVGPDGTIILPTYNWDFCKGQTFDYYKTPGMTGSLGKAALKRSDFKRTRHPIYSFAVYGKYQDLLCNMDNKDSFGMDSPFAFLHEHKVTNYIIDVTPNHCFTFAHFVEEQSGVVKHRYIKDFTADYIDENGNKEKRTYSMFVRDLDLDVCSCFDPMEQDLLDNGIEKITHINSSAIRIIDMARAYERIMLDIVSNRSRKLCTYKGQES